MTKNRLPAVNIIMAFVIVLILPLFTYIYVTYQKDNYSFHFSNSPGMPGVYEINIPTGHSGLLLTPFADTTDFTCASSLDKAKSLMELRNSCHSRGVDSCPEINSEAQGWTESSCSIVEKTKIHITPTKNDSGNSKIYLISLNHANYSELQVGSLTLTASTDIPGYSEVSIDPRDCAIGLRDINSSGDYSDGPGCKYVPLISTPSPNIIFDSSIQRFIASKIKFLNRTLVEYLLIMMIVVLVAIFTLLSLVSAALISMFFPFVVNKMYKYLAPASPRTGAEKMYKGVIDSLELAESLGPAFGFFITTAGMIESFCVFSYGQDSVDLFTSALNLALTSTFLGLAIRIMAEITRSLFKVYIAEMTGITTANNPAASFSNSKGATLPNLEEEGNKGNE